MIVKIPKLQMGGYAKYTPIISTYGTSNQQEKSQSQSKDNKESSIITEDLYKEILKDGLTNDVAVLIDGLIEIENSTGGLTNSGNRVQALKIISKIKEVQNNAVIWKDAIQTAKSNEGLGEVAVDSSGALFIQDKNRGVKRISLNDYKNNKDKYKPLSVSELMTLRERDEKLAFNSSLFTVAETAIGTSKIMDNVRNMLSVLSDYSTDETSTVSRKNVIEQLKQFSTKNPNKEELRAMSELAALLESPGDSFQIRNKVSTKRVEVDKALGFIWASLGQNEQNKLKAVAVMNNMENPINLLSNMLFANTNPSTVRDITPVYDKEDKTGKDGDSLGSQKNLSLFQLFNKGLLQNNGVPFKFNNPDLNTLFNGVIGSVGALVTDKDQSIGLETIGSILRNHGYDRIVDSGSVYFGNTKLDLYNQNNVIYDPQSGAARVYLPVGRDNMPDYEGLKEFKELYTVYQANKQNWTKEYAQEFFRKKDFNLIIDEQNGEKIIKNGNSVKPFLVMFGYTNDATGLTKDNEYIEKLSSDESDTILPILKQVWTVGTGKNEKSIAPNKSMHKEKYFKGIITIPYMKESDVNVDAIMNQGPKSPSYSIGQAQFNLGRSNNTPLNRTTNSDLLTQQNGNN